jgi:hypothetical protein
MVFGVVARHVIEMVMFSNSFKSMKGYRTPYQRLAACANDSTFP